MSWLTVCLCNSFAFLTAGRLFPAELSDFCITGRLTFFNPIDILMVWSEKKERYVYVSKAVKIKAIKRNIETKEIHIELVFWAYDKWETIAIGRGELTKSTALETYTYRSFFSLQTIKSFPFIR